MTPQTPALAVPQPDTINGSIRRREAMFEKAAATAYEAVQAIARDDETAARDGIDKLRLLRSVLAGGESHEPAAPGTEGASPSGLQRMRCAVDAIQAAQAVIAQWIQAQAQTLANVSEPDGLSWQRLIDHALPQAWNFESDLLLVYGRRNADLVVALRERGQRRVLFIVHPDDTDTAAGGRGDARSADGEMHVVRTQEEIVHCVEGLKRPYVKHLARLSISQGGEAKPESFDALIHKLIMDAWMSSNTCRFFARQWVEQGIANMPAIARHGNLSELDGAFRGRPAILISPGPSLDKNITQLRTAQGKALLIAPLQSLRRLYKAGVRPDFVLVLDATDLTTDPYDFFNEVPADFLTTLIVAANCHPKVVKKFQRVYFFSSSGPVDHWLEELLDQPLVNLGAASVAISGLRLAQHWGCNPIVLTGQDLALAAGGQRYAQDARLTNLATPKLMNLPGYHGGTVQTPSDYYLFHHQFELIAQRIGTSHPDLKLFNCTEGGAYIEGYDHQALQGVLQTHVLPRERTDWVALQRRRDSAEDRRRRTASAIHRLEAIRQAVDASARQADKCRRLTLRPSGSAAFFKRLGAEEQRLRLQIRAIKGFSIVYQEQIDAALRAAADARTVQDNLAASRALYSVVAQGCGFIRPLVVQALAVLRLPESGAAPVRQVEMALPEPV